jgi:hypothetical protein
MKNCLGCNRLENPKFICPHNCKDAVIYESYFDKDSPPTYVQIKLKSPN